MADAKANASKSAESLTEATLERYASALGRWLSRRAHRAHDTADMVQEVFARFLRKKDRPEVIRNPFGYLLGFARNVLLESLREEQQNPVVYDSELADVIGHEVEDASVAEPMGERERQTLLDALAGLPENHLIAIRLVDGKGMSYEEAAAASGFIRDTSPARRTAASGARHRRQRECALLPSVGQQAVEPVSRGTNDFVRDVFHVWRKQRVDTLRLHHCFIILARQKHELPPAMIAAARHQCRGPVGVAQHN